MDRREAIRQATFTLVAAVMARQKLDAAQQPGVLSVDLGQWAAVVFKHQGRSVTVSPAEIFSAVSGVRATSD